MNDINRLLKITAFGRLAFASPNIALITQGNTLTAVYEGAYIQAATWIPRGDTPDMSIMVPLDVLKALKVANDASLSIMDSELVVHSAGRSTRIPIREAYTPSFDRDLGHPPTGSVSSEAFAKAVDLALAVTDKSEALQPAMQLRSNEGALEVVSTNGTSVFALSRLPANMWYTLCVNVAVEDMRAASAILDGHISFVGNDSQLTLGTTSPIPGPTYGAWIRSRTVHNEVPSPDTIKRFANTEHYAVTFDTAVVKDIAKTTKGGSVCITYEMPPSGQIRTIMRGSSQVAYSDDLYMGCAYIDAKDLLATTKLGKTLTFFIPKQNGYPTLLHNEVSTVMLDTRLG